MTLPLLNTVIRTHGNNVALKTGDIKPAGLTLSFMEVPVLIDAFRRMVRTLEFDVCEMALTTYLCAREHGVGFTALPIFLVRAFHHGAIVHHAQSGLRDPHDLEGKRVGVDRGYTVTTGVWARSVLQDEYGVDLSKITWVLSGDEHVEAYRPPSNVVPLLAGATMEEQLIRGDLAAAIGLKPTHASLGPLIPNAKAAGLAAFKARGHYPINHVVVVANRVLEKHPHVAGALFAAFAEAKRGYLERLRGRDPRQLDEPDRLYGMMLEMGADPLPYGLEPNRRVLSDLVAHATTQGILRKPVDFKTVFASGD